jgi:glyoxylase-like metal-dependent hydrolase (beta-lactamase superfamily II)
MINIQKFIFNPIQVNAFILWDETLETVLIDPACYFKEEQHKLKDFISLNSLNPVRLLNTHGHFDHVMGNAFVEKIWGLTAELHEKDKELASRADVQARNFGIEMKSPVNFHLFQDGAKIHFGKNSLRVIHVPGHSPGGTAFCSESDQILFAGDIIFNNSIGRTDLPFGDYELLISGIREKLFALDENTRIHPGHGPDTTIGNEKKYNPYLNNL